MQNDLSNTPLTLNPTNVGCAFGTTSTITTTADTACSINGKFCTVYSAANNAAATSPTINAATGAAFAAMAANKATVIVVGINAAGQVRLAQGSVEDTEVGVTTTKGAFKQYPQFPVLPDNFCPIGYGYVRTAPDAAAWTCGTSSWTASGIYTGLNGTTTMQNVNGTLPDRPAIA